MRQHRNRNAYARRYRATSTRYAKYIKKYQSRNRKRIAERVKRWRRLHWKEQAMLSRKRYQKNRKRYLNINRARQESMKLQSIHIMGGKCRRCSISDIRVLEFHHRLGDGYKDKRRGILKLYREILKDRKLRKRLEVLCANCHRIADWKLRQARLRKP